MDESTKASTKEGATQMVTMTEIAAQKIKEIMDEEKPDQPDLRIYVEGGGCAGFQYGFAFDERKEDDEDREPELERQVRLRELVQRVVSGG